RNASNRVSEEGRDRHGPEAVVGETRIAPDGVQGGPDGYLVDRDRAADTSAASPVVDLGYGGHVAVPTASSINFQVIGTVPSSRTWTENTDPVRSNLWSMAP